VSRGRNELFNHGRAINRSIIEAVTGTNHDNHDIQLVSVPLSRTLTIQLQSVKFDNQLAIAEVAFRALHIPRTVYFLSFLSKRIIL
jgi:hypothetical protein